MLLQYYMFKRTILFLDEWCFYILLTYFYSKKLWIPLFVGGVFGIFAIYTSYVNLETLEMDILQTNNATFKQITLYPFGQF
jgi:hypothetical protein